MDHDEKYQDALAETPSLIRRRRALALRIADTIERTFKLHRTEWDHGKAARIIDAMLPLTYAEADEQMAQLDADEKKMGRKPANPGPSILDELRAALGHNRQVSLRETLRSAINRIKAVPP